MRAVLCSILGLNLAAMAVVAADTGVPPRHAPADYPSHEAAKGATLAAAIVPVQQVRKMFTDEISRNYIVVEVAVYPEDGRRFDVDWYDFGLKVGDRVAHAEHPRDVVLPWAEKKGPESPVHVTTESGVSVAHTNDPIYGKRTSVGTYEGVSVDNYPRQPDPPPNNRNNDPNVEGRLHDKELPQGGTGAAVAGYLYFPQYSKRKKNDAVALQYSKDAELVELPLPVK